MAHIDGVYWTLWVELKFYFLILLMLAIGLTRGRAFLLAVFWAPLAALAQGFNSDVIDQIFMPEYAPLFSAGIIIYLLTQQRSNPVLWAALGISFVLAVFQLNGGSRLTAEGNVESALSPVNTATILGISLLLVCIATLTNLSKLRARWMTSLGLLTYPLYLVHEHWGWWVLSQLRPLPNLLALFLATAAVLFLAWGNRAFD